MNIKLKNQTGIYKFEGLVIPPVVMMNNEFHLVDMKEKVDQEAEAVAEVYEITDNVQLSALYQSQIKEIEQTMKKSIGSKTEKLIKDAYSKIEEAVVGTEKLMAKHSLVKVDGKLIKGHKKIGQLTQLVKNDFNVYLVGPAGSGKSTAIENVAQSLEMDLYYNNSVQNSFDLLGFINATGDYVETEFYKAFTQGGLFFLDEIDTASPDALITLNSAIANRKLAFPNGTHEAHEDFKVCASANTYGVGADRIYVGRNALDGATLDRFIMIDFDYDVNLELSLIGNDKNLYADFQKIRKTLQENKTLCTTRALLGIHKIISMYNASMINLTEAKELAINSLLLRGLSKNQIKNLRLIDSESSTLGKLFNTTLREA